MRTIANVVRYGLFFYAALALAQSSATYGGDDLRTGWYPSQPLFTPQAVAGPEFGKIFDAPITGQVYAQPLVWTNILFVATEDNWIYGLDPANGGLKWSRNIGQPWQVRDVGCPDLSPNIGVTGTPVIDAGGIAYFFKKTYTTGTSGPGEYWMHAVDVSTGGERPGFPVKIVGVAQNDPATAFNPSMLSNRTGLLLMNGVVYAGFGGMCDRTPYKGWVVGVSTAGKITAMWTVMKGPYSGGGLWQSGGGLVSDGPGRIFMATGNGIGASPNAAHTSTDLPSVLSQSVVRLAVQTDGTLKGDNFFAPYDAISLDTWDADLGSSSPVGLPSNYFGTSAIPKLLVLGAKQGYIYLLNRDNLGGQKMGSGGGDQVVARIGPYGGVWSRPAVWPGDGGYIYLPTASAGNTPGPSGVGHLRIYKYGLDGLGKPALSLVATANETFGYGTSSPIVTSNGATSGSALLWLIKSPDASGTGAQLVAYDAVPVSGALTLRFSAPIGTASKFTPPGVGPARIYVGTRDGHLLGFGIPVVTPLTGPATDFGIVTVGQTKVLTVTLTANQAVTLTSVATTNAQFALGTLSLPKTLAKSQTVAVPLTFRPTASGLVTGSLHVVTDKGPVDFTLSGTGQGASAEIKVYPLVASLGGTAPGGQLSGTLTFTNAGGTPLTVTGATLPTVPFTASGYPPPNFVMQPLQSVVVNILFRPTAVGNYTSQFTLATSFGNATAQLTGSATTAAALVITPAILDFGSVTVGNSLVHTFTVKNSGGTTLTITKSKPPILGQFFSVTSLDEGSTLSPGASKTIDVRFSPITIGALTDTWTINSDAPTGLQVVTFRGTGVAATGSLTASSATPQGLQNLTSLGTADWVHWGLTAPGPGDRKANGGTQISDYRVLNGAPAFQYGNDPTAFSWNNGTPNNQVTSTTTGVYTNSLQNGFEVSAPAGTEQRTLRIYVGIYKGAGKLAVSLSDASAADYVDTSFQNASGYSGRVYTIVFRAGANNQRLTVRYSLNADFGSGNVALQAATLEANLGGSVAGSMSATPASVTLSGALDWVHWGLDGPHAVNRKTGASPQIWSVTPIGSSPVFAYNNSPTGYSWTGGSPVATASNATAGIFVWGKDNGFHLAVPADQTQRTLNLYVGVYRATGRLTAMLSDGSAPGYINTSLSNATATSNGTYVLTYRASKPGQTLTVTFTRTSTDDSGNVTLQAAAIRAVSPTLTGEINPTLPSVTLSSAGVSDWVHLGLGGPQAVNRMTGAGPQIGSVTPIGSSPVFAYNNSPTGYSWTGGTPVATASNMTAGIFVWGKDNGFHFAVPADQTQRTLNLYVGVYRATGRLTATLSDGSAPEYINTSLSNATATSNGTYMLTYRASKPGQTLTVTFTRTSTDDSGNVTMQAVTLAASQ